MRKTVIGVFILLVAIQWIPVDRTQKPIDKNQNFAEVLKAPKPVVQLLKNACYDCHSNEVNYPSYAYIAPISWMIKGHINEGREHVNFSEWSSYNQDQKSYIIDQVVESVKTAEMPFKGYVPLHPEANLTSYQRQILVRYFQELQTSKSN